MFWGQEGSGIGKIGAGAWKKVQIQSIIGKVSDLMGRAKHFLPTKGGFASNGAGRAGLVTPDAKCQG